MNAQKISGAKEAITIIKNNVRFASLCNDVIGDICGIVSGAAVVILWDYIPIMAGSLIQELYTTVDAIININTFPIVEYINSIGANFFIA